MASGTITCPNCGVENPANDAVCFFCRHRLSGSDTAQTMRAAPAPARRPPTMHSAPTQATPSQAPTRPPATGRLPAQTLLNRRYPVRQELAHGAIGAAYLAQHTQLATRLVAGTAMPQRNLSEPD